MACRKFAYAEAQFTHQMVNGTKLKLKPVICKTYLMW